MKRIAIAGALFALAIAAWDAAVRAGLWPSVLVPAPADVARYVEGSIADASLFEAIGVTLRRLLAGYAAGLALGFPLGLLCARFQAARDTCGIVALGLQTLPSVCWVPLALLWFGQSEGAMLFVVVMGTVGSVVVATADGVRGIAPIYARAARTMGSRGLHTWLFVRVPAALPHLISGMKQGWAFAWRSLMAAEIFVSILSGFGLGQLLHYGRELSAMDQVMGVMLVIVAIGLAADKAIFSPWEAFVHRRWGLR